MASGVLRALMKEGCRATEDSCGSWGQANCCSGRWHPLVLLLWSPAPICAGCHWCRRWKSFDCVRSGLLTTAVFVFGLIITP